MNDSALRSLDIAASTLSVDERQRAAASLERIIATDPGAPTPRPPRRRRGRLALAALAVVPVVAGGWFLLPKGDGGAAYASWTATPTAVGNYAAVDATCKEQAIGGSIDMNKARIALAERRGEYVVLLYQTDNPDVSAPCLVRNPVGSDKVDVVGFGVTGSSGPAPKAPAKGFTQGGISQFSEDHVSSVTDGVVGAEVVGVTIHAGKLSVQASVKNGRYAAWWPGRAFPEGPPQPSGRGGPEEILTYDLTLADGTVIRNASPSRPT
jgi:hypothetical protein